MFFTFQFVIFVGLIVVVFIVVAVNVPTEVISLFPADESQQQQKQPLAKVSLAITMEFGSSIESRLHGLWTDTSFDLQLLLYESALHPIGFTFNK